MRAVVLSVIAIMCGAILGGCSGPQTIAPTRSSTERPSQGTAGTGETEIDVSKDTGEYSCVITKVFSKGGKDYVVVDDFDVSWGDEGPAITNASNEPKTFEVPSDATIGSYYLATDLHGEDIWADAPMGEDADGYPMSFAELRTAFTSGRVNTKDYPGGNGAPAGRMWSVKVDKGKVVSLVEVYEFS